MQFLVLFAVLSLSRGQNVPPDFEGYVMFCPCMGRFGNQADHYLGALAFAKGLNRTLVLPPFVEYRQGNPKSVQVPFETYFEVGTVRKYHRVVTMEDFFENIADRVWKKDRRISFCYSRRQPSPNEDPAAGGKGGICFAKSGNPFGPFWDTFGVDFVGSETYGPDLHYDVHHSGIAKGWADRYPPEKWPVLAFTGAPASYPVQKENVALHRHLFDWNRKMSDKAQDLIKNTFPKGGFVAVHLRNGVDWSRACDVIPGSPTLFAAAQCVGYRNENGKATKEMCFPSKTEIFRQLKRAVKSVRAKWVFVASDNDHMLVDIEKELKLPAVRLGDNDPHLDLAVMGWANHFIGNCVSSFSAFVKRERDVRGFPTTFFGFPTKRRDEL